MSTTKSAGSTRLGRDSRPKYLGVKLFAGEKAKVGQILIRQRGTKWVPGKNVRKGSDDTLYAMKEGLVSFKETRKLAFNNTQRFVKVISVL
ncbi:MAG: 50S ribosomal protein L27 [bacterium]|nr:50S ribosomal protein L27 [bacterium]